ncbi:MAG TPA: DUF4179 domain-containing protein [Candidatus Paenibacillus intestinavium]|nr:DUF4179 domain-containing protein [Candidatus Paenibacillus intestinavium]
MQKNQTGKTSMKSFKRGMVVAIALLTVGTTAYAAPNAENFKMFFGKKANVAEQSKSVINETQVVDGIKMTVEESIIGGNSAIIMATFEKEDGSTFPQDAVIQAPELKWSKDASYMVEQHITEDGQKIITMFDVDTAKSIDGHKVTITADAIVHAQTEDIISKGPFKNVFIAQESSKSHVEEMDMRLLLQAEELELHDVTISALGIGIEGKRINGNVDELPQNSPNIFLTTTDGMVIELHLGSTSTTDIGFSWNYNLDRNGNRIFLDVETIKSITIENEIIQVTQ